MTAMIAHCAAKNNAQAELTQTADHRGESFHWATIMSHLTASPDNSARARLGPTANHAEHLRRFY